MIPRIRMAFDPEFAIVSLWVGGKLELGALRQDGDCWVQWSTEPITTAREELR